MIHCFTECIIKSDDDYRTRFDCVICKKAFYQLKDRTSQVEPNSSLVAGSILLKDGTPYKTCGICESPHRLIESKKVRLFVPFTKPENNVFEGWEELEPTYRWVVGPLGTPVRIVQRRSRMVILSTDGCPTCWNFQDSESQKLGRMHVYGAENTPKSEAPLPPSTTIYKKIESPVVVPYSFPTSGRTKVQQWGQTKDKGEFESLSLAKGKDSKTRP